MSKFDVNDIHDILEATIPMFSIHRVKIYWCGNVDVVSDKNELKTHILVIASPGIFLIDKKKNIYKSKLLCGISFFDLNSIILTNSTISFSGQSLHMRIKSTDASYLASIVFIIRQSQFPTDVLPMEFTITETNQVGRQSFKPPPLDSLFYERTLSCIYYMCPTFSKDNENVLTYISNSVSKTIKIDNAFFHSPALKPLVLSLAYE